MRLSPVIGLETHIQLKTKSKLFSGAQNAVDDAEPNAHISAIDLGHPGTLPVPNAQAIEWAVRLSLALNGEIATISKFDRKHYFYPDLPKAYQISQFDAPIMQNGWLEIDVPGHTNPVKIRIERLHLEEDAAKNIHGADGKSYVDYNRAGAPLCEIVTKPDFRNSAEAKAYLQELRLIARTLGVSDADMEKGQLRCDVNISLREVDENGVPVSDVLHPKTEIKNVNSFRNVERAIEYEIKRQTELWEKGAIPSVTTTRGWNDEKQATELQREKEGSADYRYFPEPDIPPMDLRELERDLKRTLPELPRAKRERFVTEYGLKPEDAKQFVDEPALATFVERVYSELQTYEKNDAYTKLVPSWILNKLQGLLADRGASVETMKLTPENFAEFLSLLATGAITGPTGLKVLEKMLEDGSDPSHVVESLGAKRIDSVDALESVIDGVLAENPKEVERYKAGEKKLLQFFLGQVMKETRGNADPELTAKLLSDRLA